MIAIATIPQEVISFQYEKQIWLTLFENSPQARRMHYCTSVSLLSLVTKIGVAATLCEINHLANMQRDIFY